jgi:hypothetical protein
VYYTSIRLDSVEEVGDGDEGGDFDLVGHIDW